MIGRIRSAARLLRQGGARAVVRRMAGRATGASDAIDDEFVRWLSFANAGMLHPGNVAAFERAFRELPSRDPIVEIGSFCGLSTNVLTHLLRKGGLPNTLLTCDPWLFEGAKPDEPLGGSPVRQRDYREFVRASFIRNVRFFSGDRLPHTIERDSRAFFEDWRHGRTVQDVFGREVRLGGPIAFAYIDGDHRYGPAWRDFEDCDAQLVTGGFLLFDDSADGSGWEVNKVVKDVLRAKRYARVLQNPNYLLKKL